MPRKIKKDVDKSRVIQQVKYKVESDIGQYSIVGSNKPSDLVIITTISVVIIVILIIIHVNNNNNNNNIIIINVYYY